MRPKILAIQFRTNESVKLQEQASLQREVGVYTEVTFVDALDDAAASWQQPELMLEGFQGVILGGSGDLDFDGNRHHDDPSRRTSYELLDKLKPLFQYIFDHDIPTLGICYGHQILGAFAGAQVCYDEQQKKTGSYEVKLLVDKNNLFLFADLPDSFMAHYAHKDSLDRIPEGSVLLIDGGDKCRVSALQYKNNIFTTQFHPELSYEDAMEKIKQSPSYVPEGVIIEELFSKNPDSNKILCNFGRFVAEQVEKAERMCQSDKEIASATTG